MRGHNVTTPNPLTEDPKDEVTTGAFVPFGTATKPDQVIPGRVPCSGAVFRLAPGASVPELVAWGFRNPYGLAFSPDGRLYVTENGYDERGSRPLFGAGDYLWAVEPGRWYGFPDFAGGRPVTQEWFKPEGKGELPQFLLAEHPGAPPRPVAFFGVHSSSNGLDFSRGGAFGHGGQAFVAQVLFMRECNGCHPGGAGGLGPGIANKPLPGFAMRTQIRAGLGAMPAFTDTMLSDAEVDAIVDYLNALQETPGPL